MAKQNPYELKYFYNNILKENPLMYGHQFIVEFIGEKGQLPDFLQSDSEKPESITYYVQSASVPEEKIKESTVAFLSQDFVVPNQVFYDGTWDVKVLIDQNLTHYQSLYFWQNAFASLQKSGGGTKIIPQVRAKVGLLDSTLQTVVHTFFLEGVFPTKIPDLQMQYENASTPVDFNCTFNYQYLYYGDKDPLEKRK